MKCYMGNSALNVKTIRGSKFTNLQQHKMENSNKLPRRIWSAEETKAFLDAYGKRKFESARLKKFAMKNVLEDLISLGVLTQPTTEEMLRVKLKNLLRAYKTAVDNNKRTGASLIKAPYEDQMSEIFGSQPIIKNTHSINLCGKQVEGLPMKAICCSPKECSKTPEASSTSSDNRMATKLIETVSVLQPESSISLSPEASSSSPIGIGATSSKRQGMMNKKKYWEMREKRAAEKNEILREYTANKFMKMDEAERGKEARLARKEKLLRELFDKP